MKKAPGGFTIYTSVPKIIITGYTVLEIWCVPDVIVIFHFELFLPFQPTNSAKNENIKTVKKDLEISSVYTDVPKIMIIVYTVPAIWRMTDVPIIFLGYFLPFYPHNSAKKQNEISKN